jgi:hypothetical protein
LVSYFGLYGILEYEIVHKEVSPVKFTEQFIIICNDEGVRDKVEIRQILSRVRTGLAQAEVQRKIDIAGKGNECEQKLRKEDKFCRNDLQAIALVDGNLNSNCTSHVENPGGVG